MELYLGGFCYRDNAKKKALVTAAAYFYPALFQVVAIFQSKREMHNPRLRFRKFVRIVSRGVMKRFKCSP